MFEYLKTVINSTSVFTFIALSFVRRQKMYLKMVTRPSSLVRLKRIALYHEQCVTVTVQQFIHPGSNMHQGLMDFFIYLCLIAYRHKPRPLCAIISHLEERAMRTLDRGLRLWVLLMLFDMFSSFSKKKAISSTWGKKHACIPILKQLE